MKTLTCIIIVSLSFLGCGGDLQDSDPSFGKSETSKDNTQCGDMMDVNGECVAWGTGSPVTAVALEGLRLIQKFDPIKVTDCIPGGDIGRDVHYVEPEKSEESRALYLELQDLTPEEASGIDFSSVFGLDVTAVVSTKDNANLDITGQIMPGNYGVFYRQTVELQRVAVLLNAQDEVVGRAMLTDWIFIPELAIGPTCIPESSLQASARACDGDCDDTAELQ